MHIVHLTVNGVIYFSKVMSLFHKMSLIFIDNEDLIRTA